MELAFLYLWKGFLKDSFILYYDVFINNSLNKCEGVFFNYLYFIYTALAIGGIKCSCIALYIFITLHCNTLNFTVIKLLPPFFSASRSYRH